MKRSASLALTAVLLLLQSPAINAAQIKAGTKCNKAGLFQVFQGKKYTCIKSGKKLIWDKGRVVAKSDTDNSLSAITSPGATVKAKNYPAVIGPEPSQRAIAFYYGWYGTPQLDGQWIHWDDFKKPNSAPDDIQSDYFPQLGAYSSSDDEVIAQQMAWMRQSGVGVIAVSYWPGETSDARLKTLFSLADKYRIKVTFHIEPSAQRDSTSYADTIISLYNKFGSEPAFFKTSATSRYVTNASPHPIFFVWATSVSNIQGGGPVSHSYWAPGNDRIHREINALMIACPGVGNYTSAILDGRFDGAYNYVTLNLAEEGYFNWWQALPENSLYIPSVIPGNSAVRVGYDPKTYIPRRNGAEYNDQWQSALDVAQRPEFVTITSWNEWHEGTSIEPAMANYISPSGRKYADFGPLENTYYLKATADWIKRLESKTYAPITGKKIRLTVESSSDWMDTEVTVGQLIKPESFTSSGVFTRAEFINNHFFSNQSVTNANAGKIVALQSILYLVGNSLSIKSNMGAIGGTRVIVESWDGTNWNIISELTWSGTASNGTTKSLTIN